MHLTNYSINKNSKDFIKDDDEGGSKRLVSVKDSAVDISLHVINNFFDANFSILCKQKTYRNQFVSARLGKIESQTIT